MANHLGARHVGLLIGAAAAVLLAGSPASAHVGPGYDVEMSRMIPMRDGVQLEAWIFKPSNLKGRAPAVLMLTQYDIDGPRNAASLGRRGYPFVAAYVRGRGRPSGVRTDKLGLQVGRDGHDAVNWIAAAAGAVRTGRTPPMALPTDVVMGACRPPSRSRTSAALALQHRLPILSRDEHFDVVPGLDRRSW